MKDIMDELKSYIRENDPRKGAKLASTFDYRRLQLRLLREILVELRKINKNDGGAEIEE
ncbi:MAG TPA: hypothetical protein VMZ05_02070 [Spirochaetota bacterium]|nr:hypothetical protein [Spirochaetota bacterium]